MKKEKVQNTKTWKKDTGMYRQGMFIILNYKQSLLMTPLFQSMNIFE
jgi:hypothetical protein